MKQLITTLISEENISIQGAAEMFIAAAVGTTESGDSEARLYRSRLKAIVDVLIRQSAIFREDASKVRECL